MAIMIDKKPEYKGEGKVWESLSDNLPGEAIVYNGRCLLYTSPSPRD